MMIVCFSFSNDLMAQPWDWVAPAAPGVSISTTNTFEGAEVIIDPDPAVTGTQTIGGFRLKYGYALFEEAGNGIPSPNMGTGTMFYWMPDFGAMRLGRNNSGTVWNPGTNVGLYSFGMGFDTKAEGNQSASFGTSTEAKADNSAAFGDLTIIDPGADNSLATGQNGLVKGKNTVLGGEDNVVESDNCIAMGRRNIINTSSIGSSVFGSDNTLSLGNSLVTGRQNLSSAGSAFASGSSNIINGGATNSMVSGVGNTVTGQNSFAFGSNTTAVGNQSFSGGLGNTMTNQANGNNSIAYGEDVKANGSNSVALGIQTEANGNQSLSGGGPSTVANGFNSIAWGAGNTTAVLAHNSLAFGQGTSANARQSMTGGNSSITNANNSIAWGHTNTTFSTAINSVALGENSKTLGAQSLAGGSNGTTTEGDNSLAFGKQCSTTVAAINAMSIGEQNISFGANSISTGFMTQALGDQSFSGGRTFSGLTRAFGHSSIAYGTDVETTVNADNSFAMGNNTSANGHQSFAGGSNRTATNAANSLAFGDSVTTGISAINAVAFGKSTQANGAQSLSGGNNNTTASGLNSIAFGNNVNTSATADNSVVTGMNNTTNAKQTLTVGTANTNQGENSVVGGENNFIGPLAKNSMVTGAFSSITGDLSFAGGAGNIVDATSGFSYGSANQVFPTATNGIATGKQTQAHGLQSFSGGESTQALADNSVVFGKSNIVDQPHSICSGESSTISSGFGFQSSAAFGNRIDLRGNNAFGANNQTKPWGDYSCSFNGGTEASGISSCSFNGGTRAVGNLSASFGHSTLAQGSISFVAGFGSQTYGFHSAAFGFLCRAGSNLPTPPSPDDDFACGQMTIAEGGASFTTGSNTHTTGSSSFACGSSTTASGATAMATGNNTHAQGNNSFTMGDSTTATGINGFASGNLTHANFPNSQAHGLDVVNNGAQSFAQGQRVITNADNNVTFGLGGSGTWLDNSQPNSFMVGFDSDAPTLFVSSASGNGTTGNVGIGGPGYTPLGTPNPLEKLEVWNGNIAQTNIDQVANTSATTANSSTNLLGLSPGTCPVFGLTTNNLGTTNTIPGVANSFVQVGVNATDPEIRFDKQKLLSFNIDASVTSCTQTTVMWVADPNGPSSGGLALKTFGDAEINGTFISSDRRYKENIKTLVKPDEILAKLNGVEYIYKRNEFPRNNFSSGTKYGFIAQEVQEVLPFAVHTGRDSMLSVNYDFIIPFLVEGYKFHQTRIDSLIKGVQNHETVDTDNTQFNTTENSDTLVKSIERLDSIRKQQELTIQNLILQNQNYENRLTDLETQMQFIKNCMSNMGLCNNSKESQESNMNSELLIETPQLFQNIPNPASDETEIPFFLPSTVNKASITILTVDGKILSDNVLNSRGKSSLILNLSSLTRGRYLYKLKVNDIDISVKSMIIN